MGSLTRFGRVVQAALYVQIALALFAGTAYLLRIGPIGQGGMDARGLALFFYAFAVLLFFAGRNLAQNRQWLFPVIAVVGFNFVDSSYELLGRGDTNFLPPFVFEATFLALYLTGALVLGRPRIPAASEPK